MRGSGPPRPVVGVSPAAGDKPQPYIRTAALPPAAGDGRRRYIRTVIIVSAAVGDECRRCRVPALHVFGGTCFAGGWGRAPALQGAALPDGAGFRPSHVRWYVCSPAAGDEPQPYRGRRCRRRRGTSASPRVVFDSPCVAFGRATFLGRDNDPDEFESKTVESWVRRSKSWRLRRHFRGACAVAEGYWLRIRSFDLV